MKKNFYIVTAIIQIVLMLVAFANVPTIVSNQLEAMENMDAQLEALMSQYSSEFQSALPASEEAVDSSNTTEEETSEGLFASIMSSIDMQGYYTRIYYALAFVIIVFNVVILELASKNHILRHKTRVIVYSIITFLFGSTLSLLSALIALATIIVTACLKKSGPEDEPIKAEKVTPLELNDFTKNDKLKAVLFVGIYLLLHFGILMAIDRFLPDISEIAYALTSIIADIIVFVVGIYLFKEELKAGLEALKQNPYGYKKQILKMFGICYVCMIVANILRIILTGSAFSENQAALNSLPVLYLFILAVFWAPIVEELVFRGSLRRFIKNKYVFIIVSGVLFGLVHTLGEASTFNFLIAGLPYIVMGVFFARAYEKTNNIWTDIFMHMLNNFIAMCFTMMLFGL